MRLPLPRRQRPTNSTATKSARRPDESTGANVSLSLHGAQVPRGGGGRAGLDFPLPLAGSQPITIEHRTTTTRQPQPATQDRPATGRESSCTPPTPLPFGAACKQGAARGSEAGALSGAWAAGRGKPAASEPRRLCQDRSRPVHFLHNASVFTDESVRVEQRRRRAGRAALELGR